ncbi:hypothetical protein DFH08DRAFT_807058 [Mycena albidolilacea]|uniref:Uncharacterized protein n=1 Tax=Mycena albidolilacea TaxID=1033008 RepID=A0AAD7ESU9_9AGAR|nr:hypothetical protein DFH08DRAFT_807058 [Mycena albidolilacea]
MAARKILKNWLSPVPVSRRQKESDMTSRATYNPRKSFAIPKELQSRQQRRIADMMHVPRLSGWDNSEYTAGDDAGDQGERDEQRGKTPQTQPSPVTVPPTLCILNQVWLGQNLAEHRFPNLESQRRRFVTNSGQEFHRK